ncbi:MAG: nicotinate (nicotinamide) nucleotide adenylyltransferase [Clostridia bacterium]|nr:nicotinate (nicotinamide) nucleotide adenylyltransferase [Clostridia bacterium]
MRKIGIFGGTFDPLHIAHIKLAKYAKDKLGLDFVIMLACGNPPHKRNRKITDASIRHTMLKKAIEGVDGLIACDYEIKLREFSYTATTLEFFKKIYPDDKLYFIMGGDSLDYFDKWYKPDVIASLCTIAVYGRGEKHRFDEISRQFGADIVKLDGEFFDISSTKLRTDSMLLKKHTPPAVFDFISRYRLYTENDEEQVLSELLSEKRLLHSKNVADMAKRLAVRYGISAETAVRAGLLHDIAKEIPYEKALKMCDELAADLDPIEQITPPLVHPKLGAELVKCYFGICEGEITSAIRSHTVGKPDMSLLDKIIFVADMCEEGRSFDGVENIRSAAYENIDRAVILCIESTIAFTIAKGGFVHPMAYRIKKELLAKF